MSIFNIVIITLHHLPVGEQNILGVIYRIFSVRVLLHYLTEMENFPGELWLPRMTNAPIGWGMRMLSDSRRFMSS